MQTSPRPWRAEAARSTASVLALLVLWALLSRLRLWPSYLFPGPLAVARSLGAMAADGRLGDALLRSFARLAQGYGLAVLAGVPLGITLARRRGFRSAVRPLVVGLQALPSICWLPLALLWFGLSERAIVFVVLMGSLLGIAVATEDGVASIAPLLLRASGVFGIRGLRFHLGVLLPAALPGIVTGLKLGWSFAWRALMAGELLFVAGGLGQLLQQGRELLDVAQVMAVMVAIVAVGTAVDRILFRVAELRLRARWGLGEPA